MQSPASRLAPKLSICIITYNRAEYLRQTLLSLAWLKNAPFSFEIIISDNCSSDATATVVSDIAPRLANLRYARQARTVSPEDNVVAAYRMAKGQFAVYLADDDALIPEAVGAVIEYLDNNPSVVACHCPWELWDEASGSSQGLFYRVDETTKFGTGDMLGLFDFVMQRNIFPEIGIYRVSMLHQILYQPRKAYWAFVFLARAIEHGDVAFLPYPFYRSITKHWEGETREQHGYLQALSEWDLYRGGIEFLLQRALRGTGFAEGEQDRYRKAINRFVASRMKVALKLLLAKQDYLGAFDTLVRLLPWNYLREEESGRYRKLLPLRAAAQAIVATFDAVTTLRQVGLYRIADSEKLVSLLKQVRKNLPIVSLPDGNPGAATDKDRILVVTRNATDREDLVQAGFGTGLIVVETELLSQFQL